MGGRGKKGQGTGREVVRDDDGLDVRAGEKGFVGVGGPTVGGVEGDVRVGSGGKEGLGGGEGAGVDGFEGQSRGGEDSRLGCGLVGREHG